MEAKIRGAFESVGSFFTGGDHIPWCDRDIITGCEREVAEAAEGDSEELKRDTIMRLSWALVHSKQPEDVQRGIAMLEVYLGKSIACYHYSFADDGIFAASSYFIWYLIVNGVIGIGITATAVGLIAGGIAAALARKK
ncbi:hypothetical protein POTOM_024734 [Populus tomentosa]|uniref:Uncharacterized protein n=1 Tax=Populus tomentosa TaxID=118781 RepID=A0A8X7ZCS5_POPTO|nr:hypothetical protein POTOM_024734 [Populus tomentosa]